LIVAWVATLLAVASCGADGGDEAAISEPVVSSSGETPPETTTASTSEDPPSATTAAPGSESQGQPAPDFALDLGGGGTFVLSEQTTPVLIIFWAEW